MRNFGSQKEIATYVCPRSATGNHAGERCTTPFSCNLSNIGCTWIPGPGGDGPVMMSEGKKNNNNVDMHPPAAQVI